MDLRQSETGWRFHLIECGRLWCVQSLKPSTRSFTYKPGDEICKTCRREIARREEDRAMLQIAERAVKL